MACVEYFCALAKKHNIYIVVGLVERDGNLIYNVAVLIGHDGRIIGKYRKVCLPRSEVEAGLSPGKDYPVFETRFAKVGMMVCYDGFFPEVARELSKGGRGSDRLAGLGLQSAVGRRPCLREPRPPRKQYLYRYFSQLDTDRRVRP
jgi:predicted amidohydrolase